VEHTENKSRLIYRHRLPTRLWHWVNALSIFILLMSGLNILMAHPALYWGKAGNSYEQPWLFIGASTGPSGPVGITTIGDKQFETTGLLGASGGAARGFPTWATLPADRDLATARRWHFFFAWLFVLSGFAFIVTSLINRHVQRDLLPTRAELKPSHIAKDIWNHMRLKFPHGEEALKYNILQKLAYSSVIFGLIPLIVVTGLTMSPGFNAIAPWLLDILGGRQTARSLHFIAASGILLFIVIHLIMVVLAGPWNEVRSMITGRFAIKVRD
jgi:thiosulfate reductase cytochrome b subunit